MWTFMGSTNTSMDNFIGKGMELSIRTRENNGHKGLYAHEVGNPENWYFYTSAVIEVTRNTRIENGLEFLNVHTRNSVYRFVKKSEV